MRTTFVQTLLEMAREDPHIFLLTADLGWSVLEPFAEAFPDRFLNVGVAEQNLAGVATGLAHAGFVPFIYSIANFVSMRCYEQLRNGPVLHHLPVRVIGVGGGYAYGHAGPTHHALEDLAILRALPGLTVIAPADPAQTRSAVRATADLPGPAYLRVGKGGDPEVKGLDGRFAFDRPELVRGGADLLYLATGAITSEAVKAAELLDESGVSAAVAVLAHLGPTGSPALTDLLAHFPAVVTVEEGVTTGGLGALVAKTITCNGLGCRLAVRGVEQPLAGASGSAAYLRAQAGLSAEPLAREGAALLAPEPAARGSRKPRRRAAPVGPTRPRKGAA
jgi:transketolase